MCTGVNFHKDWKSYPNVVKYYLLSTNIGPRKTPRYKKKKLFRERNAMFHPTTVITMRSKQNSTKVLLSYSNFFVPGYTNVSRGVFQIIQKKKFPTNFENNLIESMPHYLHKNFMVAL